MMDNDFKLDSTTFLQDIYLCTIVFVYDLLCLLIWQEASRPTWLNKALLLRLLLLLLRLRLLQTRTLL